MKYLILIVEEDIKQLNMENVVGQLTTHVKVAGSSSFEEIRIDIFADSWVNLTDNATKFINCVNQIWHIVDRSLSLKKL